MKNPGLIIKTILVVTVLALVFQVGHFFEHIIQVTAWLFGAQDSPYMSAPGMWLMDQLGFLFFPNAELARQKYLGFELLHLFGNAIFLLGIAGYYVFIRTKKVLWAFIIEGYHLYEHVSLTVSAIIIGQSIGLSTLFGLSVSPWFDVAYRVWWHFLFNLIPSVLMLLAVVELYRRYRKRKGQRTLASSRQKVRRS